MEALCPLGVPPSQGTEMKNSCGFGTIPGIQLQDCSVYVYVGTKNIPCLATPGCT